MVIVSVSVAFVVVSLTWVGLTYCLEVCCFGSAIVCAKSNCLLVFV